MNRVLFVDDEKNILDAYKRVFFNRYDFTMTDSGAGAIEIIKNSKPFQVIVTDYKMPGMNGVELLNNVRTLSPDTIQIMLTGQAEMRAIIDLINKGKIFRFLTKPCSSEDMVFNIDAAIKQYELVTAEKELLGKTLGGSIKVLTDLLALAKPLAFYKTQRIRSLCKKMYNAVNAENKWQVEIAALLSQIGTVTMPDDILKKIYRGLTLSEEEMVMFRNHPVAGSEMLRNIPRLDSVVEIIRLQGKNYDGSGFPEDDVSEDAIPLGARILKIVIDYDNGISSGSEQERVFSEMKKHQDMYDPLLLDVAARVFQDSTDSTVSYINKELPPDELNENMYFAEDVVSADGITLGSKNQKITSAMITTLKNYEKNNQLKSAVKITEIVKQQV